MCGDKKPIIGVYVACFKLHAPFKPPSRWSPQAPLKPLEASLKPPWSPLEAPLKPPSSPGCSRFKPDWKLFSLSGSDLLRVGSFIRMGHFYEVDTNAQRLFVEALGQRNLDRKKCFMPLCLQRWRGLQGGLKGAWRGLHLQKARRGLDTQWTASEHTLHMSKPNITRVQSATQWTASVHTFHMPKPNAPHVQVPRNGLPRDIVYTCPNLM